MATLDRAHISAELAAIRSEMNTEKKGKRLEALIALIFKAVAGLDLDDQDIENNYETEEIDLFFWNHREKEGLHFLDCPLIVECKGWSKPVPGRELRYFATLLKDKGRSSGVFIALEGITGKAKDLTAGFFHIASAMAAGQTVLIITGVDLEIIGSGEELVALLRRRLLDQVKSQVAAIEGTTVKKQQGAKKQAVKDSK
ncbi:restriction endonuclease [Cystobacter fuscus]|uniref:restriction endonuclease n=1 Tax=Cystobacter fuscus TaxID=43 RepID=UPI002B295E2F|nr:restriction endonuclease [Cystobacter fuscus]